MMVSMVSAQIQFLAAKLPKKLPSRAMALIGLVGYYPSRARSALFFVGAVFCWLTLLFIYRSVGKTYQSSDMTQKKWKKNEKTLWPSSDTILPDCTRFFGGSRVFGLFSAYNRGTVYNRGSRIYSINRTAYNRAYNLIGGVLYCLS